MAVKGLRAAKSTGPDPSPTIAARRAEDDRLAPAVKLRGAAVRLGGRTLWSGVDIEIPRGEFVAILGPNGAGKSTLVKALLGLLPFSAGTVQVLGRPPGQRRGEIGYLPQRRSFDASVRVRGLDVVWLGLTGTRWGIPVPPGVWRGRSWQQATAAVRDVVELVGASPYAERPIGELSGGEQQRLLIAQALVREPALLVLDEPLDSLDLPNQAAVAALVGRVCRQRGVTVLMVAHDVNPILPYLDRVVYIAQGAAVAGRPAAVITSDVLTRLYGAPIEVLSTRDGRLVVGEPEAPALHADRHGAA